MQGPIIIQPPANPWGRNPNQPFYARGAGGQFDVVPRAPAFDPKQYAAQSEDTLQYAPAEIYDFLDWGTAAGAGLSTYTFFTRAAGQTGVTYEDTNMQQPGNLGAGNVFQVQSIEVMLKLGTDYVTTGTDAALAGANALDDFKIVMNRGYFQMFVNSSPQIGNGISPLIRMAARPQIVASGGIATGNAAALQALAPYGVNSGYDTYWKPFRLNDQLNFNCTIQFFNTPPVLPSANTTTKIGIVMKGLYARPAG